MKTDKTSIELLKKKIEFLNKKVIPNIDELNFALAIGQ
jgi:hypothetical protein